MSLSDNFVSLSQQILKTKELSETSTINNTLSESSKFATIAFCIEVTTQFKEKMSMTPGGALSSFGWDDIDENDILVGYLSHDGNNIRFQTPNKTIIEIPLSDLKVETHGLGTLIKTHNSEYIIGNFMALNDQLSPAKKMNYRFGGESTIWMRELASIGAIDKTKWEKSRSKSKRITVIWFVLVTLLALLLIVF